MEAFNEQFWVNLQIFEQFEDTVIFLPIFAAK